MITTSCSYHLRGNITQIPTKIKKIKLSSYDPYGSLTRAVRKELRLNAIELMNDVRDKNSTLLSLHITNVSETQLTNLVFQNGKTAEYQITLNVGAQVLMPDKDCYPIKVKVYRLIFNNQQMVLAKHSEIDIIRQEMYQQASQQLVRNMLLVCTMKEKQNTR